MLAAISNTEKFMDKRWHEKKPKVLSLSLIFHLSSIV
jgi:hypothetical protein